MVSDVLAVLDVGTCDVTAAIGSISAQGPVINGFGQSPCVGIKKDKIYDIGACAKSIGTALLQAEKEAGIKVKDIYVTFSGFGATSQNIITGTSIPKSQDQITLKDINLLLHSCQVKARSGDFDIIQVIPRQFAVDGSWGTGDPVGKKGRHLEIEAHIVQADNKSLINLKKILNELRFKVKGIFFAPFVFADKLLQPAEKEYGNMLVDIGGNTTGLCWFHRGKPWLTTCIPVGGEHVTSDLAIGLRTSFAKAERIKVNYNDGLQEAPALSEDVVQDQDNPPKWLVKEIVEARVLEMADLIKTIINRYGKGIYPRELVLTGGGAQLAGLTEIFAENIGLTTRIINLYNNIENMPAKAGIAGTIMEYAAKIEAEDSETDNKFLTKLINGIKNVLHRTSN